MSNKPQTATGNIYWRDLDTSWDEIKANGASYTSNGRLIYWHGQEASEAQNWLADEAQYQKRRNKLVADAAQASETFGDDELERFAEQQRKANQ